MISHRTTTDIFHQSSRTGEKAGARPPARRFLVLVAVLAAAGLVATSRETAEASHPPGHSDTGPSSPSAVRTRTPGPSASPAQQPAPSPASSSAGDGATMTCFMTEPVTNGTRTGAVTIHVGRQLRRSGGKLSEWVVIDRTSTGGVSDLAPLYLQVRDHVSSAARRATVAHATPVLAPAAAAGVVAAPCHTETPVPIRAGVNAYQGGTRPRIPRAV